MSFFSRKKHPSASQLNSSASSTTTIAVAQNAGAGGGQVQVVQTPTLAQLKAAQASEQMRDMGKENDACVMHIAFLFVLEEAEVDLDTIAVGQVSLGMGRYPNPSVLRAVIQVPIPLRMVNHLRDSLHLVCSNLRVPHLLPHPHNHDKFIRGPPAVSSSRHLLSSLKLA